MGSMTSAARPFGLAVSAAVDVGRDYACTLREWREAWERPGTRRELVANLGYPASFWRKYRFYFAYCESGFDAGYVLNYQVAFTKLEEKAGGATTEGRVGENGVGAVKAASSSSSALSSSSYSAPSLLLLALLSWVGGALAAAAAQGASWTSAPLRILAASASLAAAAASATLVARGGPGSSAAAAAAAATRQLPLPPPASLAPIRVNGKLPAAAANGGGAASTAELVAAEE